MQPRTKGLLALSGALALGFAAGARTQDRVEQRRTERQLRIAEAATAAQERSRQDAEAAGAATGPQRRPWSRRARITAALLALAVLLGAAGGAYGVSAKRQTEARQLASALTGGGDPSLGPPLMREFGCAGCHTVSGVPGAQGMVGPRLDDIARRVYVAGRFTNTPETLISWIANPKALDKNTAMPVTGVSRRQARDIAAYLLSLQ